MGEIQRYRNFLYKQTCAAYEPRCGAMMDCERDQSGDIVKYSDHLADKAAALAEKDEEIQHLVRHWSELVRAREQERDAEKARGDRLLTLIAERREDG